jgi:hypothetical protein
MPIMLEKLYDALKAAGAEDDIARVEGAEKALTSRSYDSRLAKIETRLAVLTWMTAANTAGILTQPML